MTWKEENIVNVAMMAASLLEKGIIAPDDREGHMGMTQNIISIAEKFERQNAGVDFNEGDRDYWEEIDKFAEAELLELYGREAGDKLIVAEAAPVPAPSNPCVVYACIGSVKEPVFYGTFDACRQWCEDNNWQFRDDHTVLWDLEIQDERESSFPEGYFTAIDYFSEKEGRDVDSDFMRNHAQQVVDLYQKERTGPQTHEGKPQVHLPLDQKIREADAQQVIPSGNGNKPGFKGPKR